MSEGFTETDVELRPELYASMKSEFILGLEDSLLTPLMLTMPLSLVLRTYILFILFLTIFLLKVVLKYMLNLTGREFISLIWSSIMDRNVKPVKN